MSKKILTPQDLYNMQEIAEFGELDHTTASKRHARILMCLHFVLSTNESGYTLPYTNIPTMQTLIDRFFGKRYTFESLQYWIQDLIKRGYIALLQEDEDFEKNFFSLTEHGIALFVFLYETREVLFESNSRNSVHFLN